MTSQIENNTVAPNEQYSRLANDTQIMRTAQSLEAHGIHAIIAANGEETRNETAGTITGGAEVFLGSSDTVKELGLKEIVDNSERFNSVRVRLAKMDSSTQNREMIKMGAVPEYIIGSVQAVTEDGSVVIASNTGSQLAPYAASAAHVIWVVGSQKIVRTLEEGFERVYQYALPLEDARLMKEYGMHSSVNKMLIIHKEVIPGRTTIILVKEKLGF